MKVVKMIVALVVTMFALASSAFADLTAVTGAIDTLEGDVSTAAALVIVSGLVLMALKFGGRWLVGLFKSFAH